MKSIHKIVCPYCGGLIDDMLCPSCGYRVRGGEQYKKIDIPGEEAAPQPAKSPLPIQPILPQPAKPISRQSLDVQRAQRVREKYASHTEGRVMSKANKPKMSGRNEFIAVLVALCIFLVVPIMTTLKEEDLKNEDAIAVDISMSDKESQPIAKTSPTPTPSPTPTMSPLSTFNPEPTPISEAAQIGMRAALKTNEFFGTDKLYGQVVNVKRYANVRKEPDAESEKTGSAPKGGIYEIISTVDGWYKISIDETTGFISADFLTKYDP